MKDNPEGKPLPKTSQPMYGSPHKKRKLPILPDANLILTRDSNGRRVYRDSGKPASPNP
ncbi:MAG: hypothetical protein WBF90_38750 [Rivularia sp. (in: cyanobacteria)]